MMSNKEQALNLIDSFDEAQLVHIVDILKSVKSLVDEALKEYKLTEEEPQNA